MVASQIAVIGDVVFKGPGSDPSVDDLVFHKPASLYNAVEPGGARESLRWGIAHRSGC